MRLRILSFPGEFCKARSIAIGPKGGRYYAGSERTDSHGRKVRSYVGKDEPKEGDTLARYSEAVRKRGERDKRLPPVAHVLTRVYKGQEVRVAEAEVGRFVVHVDGQEKGVGRSLTGALSHALGRPVSGFAFMRLGSAWDEGAGQRDWRQVNEAKSLVEGRLYKETPPGSKIVTEHRKGAGIRAFVHHKDGNEYIVDADESGLMERIYRVDGPRKWEPIADLPKVAVHPFERAGLGKGPYHLNGFEYKVERTPGLFGELKPGGTCAFCGASIANVCHVGSADGKRFTVGPDCVRLVEKDNASLIRKVDLLVKDSQKRNKAERLKVRVERVEQALASDPKLLTDKPHPHAWFASQGKTLRDSVEFLLKNGGASGKTDAARTVEKVIGKIKEARGLDSEAEGVKKAADVPEEKV